MALTGKATESGAGSYLGNATPTVMVTAPVSGSNKIVKVEKLLLVNLSAATVTVQVYKVASGGSISGDDWKVIKDLALDAGETVDVREVAGLHLEDGDSLRALASVATAVRFDLSYWEES